MISEKQRLYWESLRGKPAFWLQQGKKEKIGKRISEVKKGKLFSESHKRNLSLAKLGKPSPQKGMHLSEKTKRLISLHNARIWLGKKRPKEVGEKISKALKGKPQPWNRGENHPFWKGGLRGINYLERRRFRHSLQKDVFKRDNYTCQICGIKGVDLQVDHIQSWAEYVELRFSLDNCRTLCKSCHYFITFGKPIPNEKMAWGHNLGKVVQSL